MSEESALAVFGTPSAAPIRQPVAKTPEAAARPKLRRKSSLILSEKERKKLRTQRRLAAEELGLPTSPYAFASSGDELAEAADKIGYPVFVKPVMSSSGKGQSHVKHPAEIDHAWVYALEAGRKRETRVIVEGEVDFDFEITLLTVRAANGTVFCEPIGHRQESGDYVESWQPQPMSEAALRAAKDMASKVTDALGGLGLFGVEMLFRLTVAHRDRAYARALACMSVQMIHVP